MVSSLYLSEPLTCSAASRAFAHLASYSIAFGKNSVSISVTSPSAISSAALAVASAISSASSAVQVHGNYSMRIYVRKELTVANRNDTNAKKKHLPAVAAVSAEAAAASTPSAATSAAFAAISAAVAVRLREEKKY